jgi:hypothetical protein
MAVKFITQGRTSEIKNSQQFRKQPQTVAQFLYSVSVLNSDNLQVYVMSKIRHALKYERWMLHAVW